MENNIVNLIKLLPHYDDIKHLLQNDKEAHHILLTASKNIHSILQEHEKSNVDLSSDQIEEVFFLLEALCDQLWDAIHTGIFSEVPLETRKIYTVSCYYKIAYNLLSWHDQQQLEKCSELLDQGFLIGYSQEICEKCDCFQNALMNFLDEYLEESKTIKLPYIKPIAYRELQCDITILHSPSVEKFRDNHFIPMKPALLRGTINNWPALSKWRDLNYILKAAGNRTVPIEIGNNYTTEDWSQQLTKVRDFLQRQFGETTLGNQPVLEYLAQHELFDHVPVLKNDIIYPAYCFLGEQSEKIDTKAWLGPQGTISPLHNDPKHNILCQVFGTKRVILAAPEDSKFLYPHDGIFNNTSQVNAENLDFREFPLTRNVKFYYLTLQEGECLYMPPKWWHYIRAESRSFSVSFWWK